MAKKKPKKKSKGSGLTNKKNSRKKTAAARKPTTKQGRATKKKKAAAVDLKQPAKQLGKEALLAETAGLEGGEKPCLPLPDAVTLVRSCSKAPDDLPLSTPLGQLFPSPTARNSFCQCVADGVPIDRTQIPCGAGTTLQDVVDAIAC